VTDTIRVFPLNVPFDSVVQLSCLVAGAAPKPTCALSATPGANSVTSTLTITVPTTAAMLAPTSHQRLRESLYPFWVSLIFGITVVGRSRKLVHLER